MCDSSICSWILSFGWLGFSDFDMMFFTLSYVFCFVMVCCYLLQSCCFLMSDRKGVNPDGKGGGGRTRKSGGRRKCVHIVLNEKRIYGL